MKWISQFLVWLKGKLGLIPAVPAFTKPALTYDQQIHLLRSRGLLVADEPMARRCLTHHNYYRLSAYRFPLSELTDSHQFLPGTTFEQLWGLYCFDGALRLLVTEAVKRVEISTRSRVAYEFGHAYGETGSVCNCLTKESHSVKTAYGTQHSQSIRRGLLPCHGSGKPT